MPDRPRRETLWRTAPALMLLLLAPVTAEYLYGYDDSTGNLEELVGGLVVFAPLYGGAALLIREGARRTGRGWPAMLLLGLAFGVAQAGLIDHSLFNPSYRDIVYWDEMFRSSLIPAAGFNPNLAIAFTAGHMIWSIAAPIAFTEALFPRRSRTPWLRRPGMALIATGFAAAAGFVVWWHLDNETFRPATLQLVGAGVVVVALGVAASLTPGRPLPRWTPVRATPVLVGIVTLAVFALPVAVDLILPTGGLWPPRSEASWFLLGWDGLAVNVALLGTMAVLIVRWSAHAAWGPAHRLAVAGGALLANVATAFAAQPIGDVGTVAKLVHNAVALVGTSALIAVAAHRLRVAGPSGDAARLHR